jgi:hypothetical protein
VWALGSPDESNHCFVHLNHFCGFIIVGVRWTYYIHARSGKVYRQKVKSLIYPSGNLRLPSSHQPCLSVCSCTWLPHNVWDWVEISKKKTVKKHVADKDNWATKKSFRLIRQFNHIKTCRELGLLSKQLACCARDLSQMTPGVRPRGGGHNRLAWSDPSRASIIYVTTHISNKAVPVIHIVIVGHKERRYLLAGLQSLIGLYCLRQRESNRRQ